MALLVAHPKMKDLQRETTTAYVQRETGAAGGVARAMQAVTAPTAGQRMLQAGFDDAIVEGESREQTSTSTDAAGNVTTERLSERTSTLPDGQTVVVQQAQRVVQAPAFDQQAMLDAMTATFANGNSNVMTHQTKVSGIVMLHVDTQVKKEGDARKKDVKILKAKLNVQSVRFNRLNEESMAKNAALEARLAALEAGCVSDKKARTASNVVANHKKNTFSWKKMRHGVTDSVVGFATVEEAQADMARF